MNSVLENLDALISALGGLNVQAMSGAQVVESVKLWRIMCDPTPSPATAAFAALAKADLAGKPTTEAEAENRSRIEAVRRAETRYENYATNVIPIKGDVAQQIVDAGKRRRGEIE